LILIDPNFARIAPGASKPLQTTASFQRAYGLFRTLIQFRVQNNIDINCLNLWERWQLLQAIHNPSEPGHPDLDGIERDAERFRLMAPVERTPAVRGSAAISP
jgi:hypothetical protein